MKRYIRVMAAALVAIFLLPGCGAQESVKQSIASPTTQMQNPPTTAASPTTSAAKVDRVSVSMQNGQYILDFAEGNGLTEKDNSLLFGCAGVNYPSYSSLKEMKTAVLNGNFTDKEIATMKDRFPRTSKGSIMLPVTEKWYEPIVPNGYVMRCAEINERGLYFSYYRTAEDTVAIFTDQGYYDRYFAEKISMFDLYMVNEVEEERSANVYYYDTNTAKLKQVIYTIETDCGSITVGEHYTLGAQDWLPEEHTLNQEASDTVPQFIYLFGEWNGVPYFILISRPEHRWTMEELAQFGLKPYVELETA